MLFDKLLFQGRYKREKIEIHLLHLESSPELLVQNGKFEFVRICAEC